MSFELIFQSDLIIHVRYLSEELSFFYELVQAVLMSFRLFALRDGENDGL